jgi:hypothetical protein
MHLVSVSRILTPTGGVGWNQIVDSFRLGNKWFRLTTGHISPGLRWFPFREPELPGCKYRERSRSGQGQVNILMSNRIHSVSDRTQHIVWSEPILSLLSTYQVRMLTCDAIMSSVLERVSELYMKRRGR